MAVLDNGHWRFPEQLDFRNAHGFIYLIRHIATGVMYIGRKNFKLGGKVTKGKQSNWRVYTGSSDLLNQMIMRDGVDAFYFFVLEQYYTKGGVGWAEVWSQCIVETPSNQGRFLNRLIEKVSWKSTEVVTARHKARLNKIVSQ